MRYWLYSFILVFTFTACYSEEEENVQYIYPRGEMSFKIETDQQIPKQISINNIYAAFASKSIDNNYNIYIEGSTQGYDFWIQGLLPIDSRRKLDMNTGFGIFAKNKASQKIDITYQAYDVKLDEIIEPKALGELLTLKFKGWFFEKRIEDNLLNIETARKKLINCERLQLQLVEDIIEAKKQID